MDLTTQLLPDLTTNIMYEMQDKDYLNRRNFRVKMMFEQLKEVLEKSFQISDMNNEVQKVFVKRLSEIRLKIISKGNSNSFLNVYNHLEIDNNNYQQTILELLFKYRSTAYALVNKEVTASAL